MRWYKWKFDISVTQSVFVRLSIGVKHGWIQFFVCIVCTKRGKKIVIRFFFKIDNIPWIKRKKIRILFRVKKINMFKVVVRFTLYDMEMNANFAY